MTNDTVQLAVIGAGPGGYAAAFRAADLGLRVALIDPRPTPGGACLYEGCIPSKALLFAAGLITRAREASAWGIHFQPPRLELATLRARKNDALQRLASGLLFLCEKRGVRYVRGRARFLHAHALEVRPEDGAPFRLSFDHAILATGSVPNVLDLPSLPPQRLWDSTNALELPDVPPRLLALGAGYVGLEMASLFAALGSRVTVVEMAPTILPGADPELARILAKALARHFHAIHVQTTLTAAKETREGCTVTLRRADGTTTEETVDVVLIAVGRKPVSAGLGLETTLATTDDRGFVTTDSKKRTAEPSLYAIGDVAGPPLLAHKATHEGLFVADSLAGRSVTPPRAIPAVVFTSPELAWCGLQETEARQQGREVEVARFPWTASGCALATARSEGLTKLVVERGTGRLLGAGAVGRGAADLIAEAALAIESGVTAEQLSRTVHPHPTLSETLMEAADLALGRALHVFRPRPGSH